jgi:hypothetical protein
MFSASRISRLCSFARYWRSRVAELYVDLRLVQDRFRRSGRGRVKGRNGASEAKKRLPGQSLVACHLHKAARSRKETAALREVSAPIRSGINGAACFDRIPTWASPPGAVRGEEAR